MSLEGIFINGVFSAVIDEILAVQEYVPEQVLYLQPYAGDKIVELYKNPPSVERPVRLFLSLTDDLPTVRYTCEIVGWDDKRELVGRKRDIIEAVIKTFQPSEEEVYAERRGVECVNLLHVWQMKQISRPFSVAELTNTRQGQPVSTNRSTAGGWVYVEYPSTDWLESHL
jgi:hypothetical protein